MLMIYMKVSKLCLNQESLSFSLNVMCVLINADSYFGIRSTPVLPQ